MPPHRTSSRCAASDSGTAASADKMFAIREYAPHRSCGRARYSLRGQVPKRTCLAELGIIANQANRPIFPSKTMPAREIPVRASEICFEVPHAAPRLMHIGGAASGFPHSREVTELVAPFRYSTVTR